MPLTMNQTHFVDLQGDFPESFSIRKKESKIKVIHLVRR